MNFERFTSDKFTVGAASKQHHYVDQSDFGEADTLRFNVLTHVTHENYDRSIKELKDYLHRESDYPNFHGKIERYISHSVDLVHAIRAKKSFPGLANLPIAKQEEINARNIEHFRELIYTLKKIEKVQTDLRIADVRSTAIVVKTLSICIFAIFLVAVFRELASGAAQTAVLVIDDTFSKAVDLIFSLVGL